MGLCSLFIVYLGPNYGGGNEDNGNLLQKVPCRHCCTQHPRPCSRPPLRHTSAGDSWTLLGQSLVGPLLLSPASWCTEDFLCALQESVSPVLCKFQWLYGGVSPHSHSCTMSLHLSTTQPLIHCFISLQNTDTTPVLCSCGFWAQMQKINVCVPAQSCPTLCRVHPVKCWLG